MGPSSLIDPSIIVVVDASTAINLNATGYAKRILRALPNRVHMADAAFGELDVDRRSGRHDAKMVTELIQTSVLTKTSLGEKGLRYFETLVVGSDKDTLDDGEASTIALSLELKGFAVIDERKALRICGERYPQLPIGSTLDILWHEKVHSALGDEALASTVFCALSDARMRVPQRYMPWVRQLIGEDRFADCPSIPSSYKHTV